MSRALRHITLLLATAMLLVASTGVAQAADAPFTSTWAQTLRGDVMAVGNTSLSCPTGAANCTNARNRVSPFSNNDFRMAHVDVDGVAATRNSSQATVALPAGATIAWAGLYWAADTTAGTGGSAAPSGTAPNRVLLRLGSGAYQTVNSTETLTSSLQSTRFRSFADVTGLLAASGTQAVTVADIAAGTGSDRFAGWALLVAYRDATRPIRRLNVYDGLGTVQNGTSFTTTIAPFQTPATGAVTSRIGLVSFEGDDGIPTETGTFNGVAMNDALNPANNFQNSTISADGAHFTAKNPNYSNQLGVDIDSGGGTGMLANSQSSAVMTFTSTQDYYMPSAFFLVSDEGPALNTAAPSMSGTARDGATLTASPGTWSGTPSIDYTYQWQRCNASGASCTSIPGATGATYTLTPADVNATVRVQVVATNDAGSSPPAASSASATVAPKAPVSVAAPVLTGTARDEATLTASTGSWTGTGPLAYAYQWLRCDAAGDNCAAIAGATAASYTPSDADVGRTLRSTVTAANAAGSASRSSAPSAVVAAAPPADDVPPAITGTPRDGRVLTATPGTWDGTAPFTYAYRWLRCDEAGNNCVPISGATSSTYELTGADVGHTVRVRVTATNPQGSDFATSGRTAVVAAAPPSNEAAPALTGLARDEQTLTAGTGAWDGTGPFDYDYQWQRCTAPGVGCADIAGATSASYTLADADAGKVVRVIVTASNGVGEASVPSASTAVVAAAPPANDDRPAVSGSGRLLTADTGAWKGTGPFAFAYQWQRCDLAGANCMNVAGATGETYELSADDVGGRVRVVVTATNGVGSDSEASAASAPVLHAPPVSAPISPPAIGGRSGIGRVLTADTGVWSGDALAFTYQWQRCDADGTHCVDIAGATGEQYTPTAEDTGHAVRVVVTATNDMGSESRASDPSAPIEAPETPAPAPTPAPAGPGGDTPGGGGVPATDTAVDGVADPAFLAVPGSLVTPDRCQQLAGGARYRRVKVPGVGDVRVRAYTSGPGSPVQVTTTAPASKLKKLAYTIDGRRLRATRSRGAVLGPQQLRRLGWHRLVATVKGRKGKARRIVVRLKTVPCGTLFTAQRWRTTAGFGLRLRVDALSALRGVSFKVPAKLMPRRGAKPRTIGFARFLLAGGGTVKRNLKRGRTATLLGTPRIAYRGGRLTVAKLPEQAAVAEITLYRETSLDGATTRRAIRLTAKVIRDGAPAKSFAQRPRAPR